MKYSEVLLASLIVLLALACQKDSIDPNILIEEGDDPNFKIEVNTDNDLSSFNRKVMVFDIPIYAVAAVEDAKLLHAANLMATEYIYWALTSILGAQENRLNEIQQEWKLNTKEKIQQTDTAVFDLLTDPQYKLPTVLPDGTYRQ